MGGEDFKYVVWRQGIDGVTPAEEASYAELKPQLFMILEGGSQASQTSAKAMI